MSAGVIETELEIRNRVNKELGKKNGMKESIVAVIEQTM